MAMLYIDIPVPVKDQVNHFPGVRGRVCAGPVKHSAVKNYDRSGLDVVLVVGLVPGLLVCQPNNTRVDCKKWDSCTKFSVKYSITVWSLNFSPSSTMCSKVAA